MNRATFLFVLAFVLAACTRSAPIPEPTPFEIPTLEAPIAPLLTASPSETAAGGSTGAEATPTPFIITPTSAFSPTPEPSATPEPLVETEQAADAATQAAQPTASRTPAPTPADPPFDPVLAFGGPRLTHAAMGTQYWADRATGRLPNTSEIQMTSDAAGNISVTGKFREFDTWWFSGPYLEELYVEMNVTTGAVCSGRSSYGLILYGPEAGTSTTGARGYIVAFACDGTYLLRRLNSSNPYSADALFAYQADALILAGPNQSNTLGVLIRDGQISIYANGYLIATALDSTFSGGRFGLYVNAGETDNFTYTMTNLRLWDLRPNR